MKEKDLKKILSKCRKSPIYFINNFCKISHPTAGSIPFKLFSYQKKSIKMFLKNRFTIFNKCRQTGISTLAGAFALWFAMFRNHKTILIVSQTDAHATHFLNRNIQFIFNSLPKVMREIWKPTNSNRHELVFPNGSTITSKTSAPNVLRSHAASLNIVDEAAFIENMDEMWASGYPTLTHGGSLICISTPCGVGSWYWDQWSKAISSKGVFKPILIRWWEMDWKIEGKTIGGEKQIIAPTAGLRKLTDPKDINRWGPYYSPWLEEQYNALKSKGEGHLFKQEFLNEFYSGGNTVIQSEVIKYVETTLDNNPQVVDEPITHVNMITEERSIIDFRGNESTDGLWIWEQPIQGHRYVIGVDIATGKNNDYSAFVILDATTLEQVAEYIGKITTDVYCKMVDFIGRYYNNALVIAERTGIGQPFCDIDLKNVGYPNLWRQKKLSGKKVRTGPIGYTTTGSTKPALNKALMEKLQHPDEDGEGVESRNGYIIKSHRLWQQMQTYIRVRTSSGKDTKKTEAGHGNHDDLIMALAMALVASDEAVESDFNTMIPMNTEMLHTSAINTELEYPTDNGFLMPIGIGTEIMNEKSVEEQLDDFSNSLIPPQRKIKAVVDKPLAYWKPK